MGLMISPAPDTVLNAVGLEVSSPLAGVSPMRIIAGAREPARRLWFEGDVLHGVSPHVHRRWSVPDLSLLGEERPGDDPAAGLPGPVPPGALAIDELADAIAAPGGEYLAVYTREPRAEVIAILRASDRALVRWMRGMRAAAWNGDQSLFAVGADWGLILGRPLAPGESD
jgi:hypothetical protein